MSYSLEAIYNSVTWSIAQHSGALSALQEQAASGQAVNRVSDNPTNAGRILKLQTDGRSLEQYLNALGESISILDLSGSVIQSISSQITAAMSSVTSIMSGTTNSALRTTLADDINNSLEQIVSLANTQRLGWRLFGGSADGADPFQVERNQNGEITRVVYSGSSQERQVEVAPGVQMSSVLAGDSLFGADERQGTVFYGSTGAKAGAGTSSTSGDVYLTVTDDGGGGYLLSIDGGTTQVAVTGHSSPDNIPVVHGATGQVLYVDATGITSAGTEPVRTPGSYDIFNILIGARDMLRNTAQLPDEQWKKMMNAMTESLGQVEQKLVRSYPVIGGRINALTSIKSGLEDIKLSMEDEISSKQDADITQVAIDLSRHQVLYEMSLAVATKMFSLSLLDFLE